MKYHVSNKPGQLGKTVHADNPEEAAAQSKLKGELEVRWGVKFGEPGQPSTKESGTWWFASSTTIRSGKPAPKPEKSTPAQNPEPVPTPKATGTAKKPADS